MTSLTIGRIQNGQVVLEGEQDPLPEGCRIVVIVEDAVMGFRLDEKDQEELRRALDELGRDEEARAATGESPKRT